MKCCCILKLFRLFFILIWFSYTRNNVLGLTLFEGDNCILKNGGSGICRLISYCPSAIDNLRKSIIPERCGFKGLLPIVCCKDKSPIQNKGNIIDQSRIPGEISKSKCIEYAKYFAYRQYVNNGSPVMDRTEFPHMVVIGYQDGKEPIKWACGGAIVSESYILTAAHCIITRSGPPKFIMTGMVNLTSADDAEILNVSKTIVHPDYKPSINYHDIGLLKVEPEILLNALSRPICLTMSKEKPVSKVFVSGWGKTDFLGPSSEILMMAKLEVFNRSTCEEVYKGSSKTPRGIDYDIMMCAGSKEEVKDACQGDSGGPLVLDRNFSHPDRIYVIGIVSFGKPCGQRSGWPSVYTRTSSYVKWIEDIVWP